jgi:hypothetical protein
MAFGRISVRVIINNKGTTSINHEHILVSLKVRQDRGHLTTFLLRALGSSSRLGNIFGVSP